MPHRLPGQRESKKVQKSKCAGLLYYICNRVESERTVFQPNSGMETRLNRIDLRIRESMQ
jgi:hypothetical protein